MRNKNEPLLPRKAYFIHFHKIRQMRKNGEAPYANLGYKQFSKLLREEWKNIDKEELKHLNELADQDKERYLREF